MGFHPEPKRNRLRLSFGTIVESTRVDERAEENPAKINHQIGEQYVNL